LNSRERSRNTATASTRRKQQAQQRHDQEAGSLHPHPKEAGSTAANRLQRAVERQTDLRTQQGDERAGVIEKT
jgi:hypothetical protein